MTTLTATNPNLLDLAQALDPNGQIATVVEMLNEMNEILPDVTFMNGNLETGHRSTIRTGLPTPTWRRIYGGVQPDKSQRATITDTCGMLEAYAEVDADLAELSGDIPGFRLSEARAFLESMSQELASTIFYGNTSTDPEKFDGLAPRFGSLSAENADNIIDAGGTGTDNASIWLVCWSPDTVHGIVPKHSTAGMKVSDKGMVTIENADGSNGRMEAYRMHFQLKAGLCVKDWRYVVRICNIDRSLLVADASTGADLPELMFDAMERVHNLGTGRAAFYMDRYTRTRFRQQLADKTKTSTLRWENIGGVRAQTWNDIPLRRCDVLAGDEARVV